MTGAKQTIIPFSFIALLFWRGLGLIQETSVHEEKRFSTDAV